MQSCLSRSSVGGSDLIPIDKDSPRQKFSTSKHLATRRPSAYGESNTWLTPVNQPDPIGRCGPPQDGVGSVSRSAYVIR